MIKRLFILIIILICSCKKQKDIPEGFVGTWIIDLPKVRSGLVELNLPEDEIKRLESDYIDLIRNQEMNVSKGGLLSIKGAPSQLKLRMELIKKVDEKFFIKVVNPLNPSHPEYTLNELKDGVWKVVKLNDDLTLFKNAPFDFWKRKH